MKLTVPLCLITCVMLAGTSARAAMVFTFTSTSTFNTQFPTTSSIGNASAVSLIPSGTPTQVDIHAGDTGVSSSQESLYSATSFPSLNFISAPTSFTFDNLALTFSAGATYNAFFGVSNSAGGSLSSNSGGPGYAIYFQINRNANTLTLVEKTGGNVFTTLDSWTAGNAGLAYSFSSINLTVSSTGWSASGTSTNTTTFSGSGTFATALTGSNWGSTFALAMQAQQSSASATNRFADLTITEIDVAPAPEPKTVALALGGLAICLFVKRRRSLSV